MLEGLNRSATEKPNKENTIDEIVTELEKPVKTIIKKIKNRIENGDYGVIIGDDASGRIPTLILGGFIKKISKIRGVHDPKIIFIPGNKIVPGKFSQELHKKGGVLETKLKDHLAKNGAKNGDRVLIITDAIFTGKTLESLNKLLKEGGHDIDVCTMGIEGKDEVPHMESRAERLHGVNIISGEYSRYEENTGRTIHTPWIYDKRHINGVFKLPGDLKSRSIRDPLYNSRPDPQDQVRIHQSRKQIEISINNLLDWYLGQEGKIFKKV